MNHPTVDSRISFIPLIRAALPVLSLVLLLLLAIGTTVKQVSARSTRLPDVPQVAVIDFSIRPGVQTHTIQGRDAAKIVFYALKNSGSYAMTPQTAVDQMRVRHHFKKNLDTTAIQKLGKSLGQDFIASGTVEDVRFTKNPRRARITLTVRLVDVITGELANGAIETGISRPATPGYSDKAMVQDALRNAASHVVSTIKSYTLPSATILKVEIDKNHHKRVTLNRGA